ncbi:MAG: FkbM family methyltransferase, partial [Acidimicrobiia bacterium]
GMFGRAPVQLRDVVGVLEELGIDHVDLLKVNIEGGEFELFDRLNETGWLPRMRVVSVQFHEWHPKAYRRRRAVRRALRRDHREVWNYPWVWELWQLADR